MHRRRKHGGHGGHGPHAFFSMGAWPPCLGQSSYNEIFFYTSIKTTSSIVVECMTVECMTVESADSFPQLLSLWF